VRALQHQPRQQHTRAATRAAPLVDVVTRIAIRVTRKVQRIAWSEHPPTCFFV
jgi:hypothetical protein